MVSVAISSTLLLALMQIYQLTLRQDALSSQVYEQADAALKILPILEQDIHNAGFGLGKAHSKLIPLQVDIDPEFSGSTQLKIAHLEPLDFTHENSNRSSILKSPCDPKSNLEDLCLLQGSIHQLEWSLRKTGRFAGDSSPIIALSRSEGSQHREDLIEGVNQFQAKLRGKRVYISLGFRSGPVYHYRIAVMNP